MLRPIGVDAAVTAVNALMPKTSAAQSQLELALQKAAFRRSCPPAIRCCRSSQSAGGRRTGAPLERGP